MVFQFRPSCGTFLRELALARLENILVSLGIMGKIKCTCDVACFLHLAIRLLPIKNKFRFNYVVI